jgi:hypothetical protein
MTSEGDAKWPCLTCSSTYFRTDERLRTTSIVRAPLICIIYEL